MLPILVSALRQRNNRYEISLSKCSSNGEILSLTQFPLFSFFVLVVQCIESDKVSAIDLVKYFSVKDCGQQLGKPESFIDITF